MAVTATVYNYHKMNVQKAGINLATDNVKCALLSATHAINQAHSFWSDVSANEMTGTGYTAGGALLTTKAVTQDNVNNRSPWTADNVSWVNSTITNARYAVLYKDTGVAATSALIACIDFGANQSTAATDFVIQWNAAGISVLT